MQLRVNLLLWLLLLLLLFAVVIRSARDARTDTVLRHASFAGAPQPAPRFAHTSMPLNAALFIVLPAHTHTQTEPMLPCHLCSLALALALTPAMHVNNKHRPAGFD